MEKYLKLYLSLFQTKDLKNACVALVIIKNFDEIYNLISIYGNKNSSRGSKFKSALKVCFFNLSLVAIFFIRNWKNKRVLKFFYVLCDISSFLYLCCGGNPFITLMFSKNILKNI